jgi:hypothetical protein
MLHWNVVHRGSNCVYCLGWTRRYARQHKKFCNRRYGNFSREIPPTLEGLYANMLIVLNPVCMATVICNNKTLPVVL